MSVWYCVPSKRPALDSTLGEWTKAGYKIAVYIDHTDPEIECADFSVVSCTPYQGYAVAVNALIAQVMLRDTTCEWCITGGDDVLPDPAHSPEEIARECSEHFYIWAKNKSRIPIELTETQASTFGVMQPTGHRWGDRKGAYIDRVCGSPWLGREWCLRAHQGRGPMHPGFAHMFGDQALQAIATKLGVLWQRSDLTHYHRHWGIDGDRSKMPEFLEKWNTAEHWRESRELFERLQREDFAECMPI